MSMKKVTFGQPEKIVPTLFCKSLCYEEGNVDTEKYKFNFRQTARGCLIEFPIEGGERIYGFGLQMKQFDHKKQKLTLRTNADPVTKAGDSHAPVPFFVTTKCYGIYFDTARYIEAYCGYTPVKLRKGNKTGVAADNTADLYKTSADSEETVMSVLIPAAKGIDIYVFEGENILDVVSQYNMFSGGGCEVPEWGLGTIYRAYTKSTQDDILNTAEYFEKHSLPFSIIGIEPGWQSSAYSCSYEWSKERFPNHKEMLRILREKGYHINLWEHGFVHPTSPIYDKLTQYCGDYEVWNGIVPDFADENARKIFADYHRESIIADGVDGFKLDECDSSDYTGSWSFPNVSEFASGLDGEQYHQLFGTLYMQTLLEALGDTPTLSEVRNAGALAAGYPFVLYSDLYDHKDFIRSTVNSGFSGLLWTPELRDAVSEKDFIRRLQSTVFSVQCLINAWYCENMPWLEFDCEDKVRNLLNERIKLIPMLKKAFSEYHTTGKPPVRALVCDYTDDTETYGIDDEYIFCDKLIVAPMTAESDTRTVYLPNGDWVDYWTKEKVNSGYFTVTTENIPVFEKID